MQTDYKQDKNWIYAYSSSGKMQKGAKVIFDENDVPVEAEVKLGNKSFIKIPVEEIRAKLQI